MKTLLTLTICFCFLVKISFAQTSKEPAPYNEYPATLDSIAASKYFPRWLGSIDDKGFPQNTQLLSYLNHNDKFIFKLGMDFYLDMLRFKALDSVYDDKKINSFLHLHDLMFLRYENDEPLLKKKIDDCKATLREACSKLNLTDIYYKDYNVDLSTLNAYNKPFTFIPFEEKDDYFSTKRLKGETDAYYAANGLNVYLSNWLSMNEVDPKSVDIIRSKAGGPNVTMRIYFLLQPQCAAKNEGSFKGILAYGLKALLFTSCPSNPVAIINNQSIDSIEDVAVKKCYLNALAYVDSIRYVGFDEVVNTSPLTEDGYTELGQWFDDVNECEVAYNYLSGTMEKISSKSSALYLKVMTNYNCTLQPGYEVIFSNRLNGTTFSLPIAEASTVQSESSAGYYNLKVNLSPELVKKMLAAKVNRISFQCSGSPKYQTAQHYVLPYPNKVISRRLGSISSSISVNSKGQAEKLDELLGKGL